MGLSKLNLRMIVIQLGQTTNNYYKIFSIFLIFWHINIISDTEYNLRKMDILNIVSYKT